MTYYIRKFKTESLDIQTWAKNTLSSEELTDFNNSFNENSQLWLQYSNQGLITHEHIESTIFSSLLNEHITLRIGEKIIVNNSSVEIKMADSYAYWHSRFISEGGNDNIQYLVA